MSALAILNARLLDPASDYDGPGAVLVEDGRIREVVHGAGAGAPEGVEVVDAGGLCLAPGLIDTDMTAALPAEVTERHLANIPLGRAGTPREVADLVSFLVSDRAAYLTGQVIELNGGLSG